MPCCVKRVDTAMIALNIGCVKCVDATMVVHDAMLCENVTIRSSEVPDNMFNLTVVGCATLGILDSLAPLSLRSLIIREVNTLSISTQAFLYGLSRLSSVVIKNTNIPVIPSFSFGALESIISIVFENVEIGTISSYAFSDLMHISYMKFVNSKIGNMERNAFGRGKGKIAYFSLEESSIDMIHEHGIWLDNAEIFEIDKCNIRKIVSNAIRMKHAAFFYLTKSSIGNYEPGGISGRFSHGVIIDSDYINPVALDSEKPQPLFDLHKSKHGRSTVVPFFHFTNNVLPRTIPRHAFFITDPTINVAVPNNNIGECSCIHYRNFLQSLLPILDNYNLNVHQAMVEHGICLSNRDYYSIECPNLTPLLFVGVLPTNTLSSSMESVIQPTITTTSRNYLINKQLISDSQPTHTSSKVHLEPLVNPVDLKLETTSPVPVLNQFSEPDSSIFPSEILASNTEEPPNRILPILTVMEDLNSLDAQTIWNEIYGGVFALRLRKPLPETFSNQLSMKFSKAVRPLGFQRFHRGKPIYVSPR
nr:uncharacterized protein LOC128688519 [Cherax quadricarinatus]